MKVLITGAHFTPAQAVIEELQKYKGVKISYVGRKFTQEGDSSPSIESQVLPNLGVKFIPIVAGRFRKIPDFYSILAILRIPIGFIQAPFILLSEKADVVLSFGGYVGLPVVFWAWLFSTPIITHEQTSTTGLANSISNLFAKIVALSFKNEKVSESDEKIIYSGNPFRAELLKAPEENDSSSPITKIIKSAQKDKKPVIYITGGNQGSQVINEAVAQILNDLTKIAYVLHQTGDSKHNDFEKLLNEKNKLTSPERYLHQKWFEVSDVNLILRNADLAVSRAGANTLSELAWFGIPSLVIPLPYLYKNEQVLNAKYFKNLGLCQILPQSNLNGQSLFIKIKEMIKNLKTLNKEAAQAREVINIDAAKIITQQVLLLANTHG